MSRLAVAIAVGGSSTRIGSAKPLLRLGGKTLIEWAVEYAYRLSGEVYLLARNSCGDFEQNSFGGRVPERITDADLGTFPDRIAASLKRIPAEHVFLIGCDTPFLDPRLPRFLASRIGGHGAAVPALENGYIEPLAALYSVPRVPCPRGFASMRDLCMAMDPAMVGIGSVFPSWTFMNINTKEDMLSAESLLKSSLSQHSLCGMLNTPRGQQSCC
ncbi:MAG: NTP transferase domain-containing protein [Candidatus Verstraetearchaeota archaeon]|nr:NTP transferase domain-containing protein [Candidatus Verstraetearchaeota archaeon]